MNARNTPFRHPLEPCPKCNRDSGKRMQTETVPERFFIVCQSCGYRVGPCGSTSEATKKWDKEYRMKYIKRYAPEDYTDPPPVGICPLCGDPVEVGEKYIQTEEGPVHAGGKRAILTEGNKTKDLSCAMVYIMEYGEDTLAEVLGLEVSRG